MSGGLDVLALKEDDVTKLLAAGTHLGNANVDYQMAQYVYKTKADGKYIIWYTTTTSNFSASGFRQTDQKVRLEL